MGRPKKPESPPVVRDPLTGKTPLELLLSTSEKELRRVSREYDEVNSLRCAMGVLNLPHKRFSLQALVLLKRKMIVGVRCDELRGAYEDLKDDARGQYDYVKSMNTKYTNTGAHDFHLMDDLRRREIMKDQRKRDKKKFIAAGMVDKCTLLDIMHDTPSAWRVFTEAVKQRQSDHDTLRAERTFHLDEPETLKTINCKLKILQDDLEALGYPCDPKERVSRGVQKRGRPRKDK